MDEILFNFAQGNSLTIAAVLGLLKVLATYSDNNVDDAIVSFLFGIFRKK